MPALMACLLVALFTVFFRRLSRGPRRPTWSFGFEVIVVGMKRLSLSWHTLPPAARRAKWASLDAPSPVFKDVSRRDETIDGVPGAWFEPKNGTENRTLLYLHGGAYTYGSPRTHAELIARIALESKAAVFAPDYRLAPEHPFPAGVDDVYRAYEGLLARGVAPDRLVVGGDSAGSALACAIVQKAREAGRPLPAALVLNCPWVDLSARGGSLESNSDADWGVPSQFVDWARDYVAGQPEAHPLASPGHADLKGFPPALIQVGTSEMLLDQARAFVAKAKAAGVDVECREWPDMVHNWHVWAGLFEVSRRAIAEIGAFVRARTP